MPALKVCNDYRLSSRNFVFTSIFPFSSSQVKVILLGNNLSLIILQLFQSVIRTDYSFCPQRIIERNPLRAKLVQRRSQRGLCFPLGVFGHFPGMVGVCVGLFPFVEHKLPCFPQFLQIPTQVIAILFSSFHFHYGWHFRYFSSNKD